jgi:diguanylate cyclase (GGDEF)-like protein/PAS domain S-box-containing protein
VNERSAFEDGVAPPGVESPPADRIGSPPAGYAGRPRDAQLEYKAILANASIGIAFTRDRRFTLCNPKFADILGWQAEELIGLPGEAVYPSRESYEAMGAIAMPLLSGGRQLDVEWELRRKDGSTFLARVIAKSVSPSDNQKGTVWIVEDITVRKRAEEEMHRLLSEQQAITNNVMIGIAFLRDRKVVRCNRRFEELFGYAPGEAAGIASREYYFSEEDYQGSGRYIANIGMGDNPTFEQWLRRKDGSGFWCRRTGRALEPGNISKGYVWLFEDITERKRADGEVQRMVREQDLILGNATVGIAFVRNRTIQRCNRFLEEMVGAAPGALIGQPSSVLFATEEEWKEAARLAYSNTEPGATHDTVCRFKRSDGSTFLCRTRGRRIDAGGKDQEWIWSYDDVTLEREAEARVQRALAEQELILANANVGIAFARQRLLQRCNPRFAQMFGYDAAELIGKGSTMLFESAEEYESTVASMYARLSTGEAYVIERQLRRKDGSLFWCKLVARAIDPLRPEEGTIGIYEDITTERAARESLEASRAALKRAVAERTLDLQVANERLQAEIADRRVAETRAQHLADHDPLTGLPNRRLLEDRLTQALAASQRNRKQTAVVFVDLDRFKSINDTLGHAAGDAVLKEVAERLMKQLRVVDTVCRMGGDEFVVILPEIKRAADAANVAAKVLETMAQPFVVEGRELHITPSIGISVFPDDGRDAESLIRNADAAMYHAKGTGRANYQFFTEQMNLAASRRLVVESDLRRAVHGGELRMYYQPIIDAASGRPVSCEALLRWQHPTRGVIGPDEFIQVAEDTGLILPLGEWTLEEACRWACGPGPTGTAPGAAGTAPALSVSVNLSARQFSDPKLFELVARVLKSTGLAPQRLELEIAEAVAMQQPDIVLAALNKLKGLGVRLALDDFGIGLSGVAYLSRVPVDLVKIDRSLIAGAPKDAGRHPVVPAIVGLGHALGLKVVAKGVETEAQKAMLLACGCDYLQGFLTGKPVDAETAARDFG